MRPEIVLTVGPASDSVEAVTAMIGVATRFRLNAGHLDPETLRKRLERFAECFGSAGVKVRPVVIDLQGGKLRIGKYPAVTAVPEVVELRLGTESEDPAVIPVPHESVFQALERGDPIHLNDGKVILKVDDTHGKDRIRAIRVRNGELGPQKGLNCPTRDFTLERPPDRDLAAVKIGMEFPFVEFAVSFVTSGQESQLYRPLTSERRLIAKIERSRVFKSVPVLDGNFDELWLCRGDLGSEIPYRELGPLQAEFARMIPHLGKPRLLAGEVLGSMILSPVPSRSEIVHLHDILRSGFDGFVLSDETARGKHLNEVLEFLREFFPRG